MTTESNIISIKHIYNRELLMMDSSKFNSFIEFIYKNLGQSFFALIDDELSDKGANWQICHISKNALLIYLPFCNFPINKSSSYIIDFDTNIITKK